MRRYSIAWWFSILPTTVIVGGPVFLALVYQTDWGIGARLAVTLISALFVDLAIAVWMERVAPTKVRVGPGERQSENEIPADKAIVLSGFDKSPEGRISVRGETWAAVKSPGDTANLAAGTAVSVVDRVGLILVVSASPT